MALIKCPECRREISDKAASCPGCGCPASEFKNIRIVPDVSSKHKTRKDCNRGIKSQGYQLVKNTQVIETQEDLERVANEIYAECQNDFKGSVAGLMNRTGIDYQTARDMMFIRYHGKTEEELKRQRLNFKYNKWKKHSGTNECPRCGSQYIDSYWEQGISITSETSLFGGMLITHPGNINQKFKCLYCGYTWNPYKKN